MTRETRASESGRGISQALPRSFSFVLLARLDSHMTAPFIDDHKPLPMVEKFEKLPPPPPQADYQEPDYAPPPPPPKIVSDSNGGPHNLLPPIPTMASIGDLDDSASPV